MDAESFERMAERNKPKKPEGPEWVDAEVFDQEDQAVSDMQEAIRILITMKTLIDYVGNPDLCRSLSRRERTILEKVSTRVGNFLGSVVPTYIEE